MMQKLTFRITLLIGGVFRSICRLSGLGHDAPELLERDNLGGHDHAQLPCLGGGGVGGGLHCDGYVIEEGEPKLGAYLRAGTEPSPCRSLAGVNVPVMVTLTCHFGAALAAFAGVLPLRFIRCRASWGCAIIIVVFAVVVIGGMGSIMGSIPDRARLGCD